MLQEPKMSYQLIPGRAGRGRRGFKPRLIVLHIQEGTGPLGKYFAGVDADSTAWVGYLGQAERYLYDTDEAWTDGAWAEPVNHADPAIQAVYNDTASRGMNSNVEALTIEHEGFAGKGLTTAQLETSAQIIAYWCSKWAIPCDRQHIVGHYEVGEHKNCPGPNFPFDQLIARAQAILVADSNKSQPNSNNGNGGANPVEGADGKDYWVVYPITVALAQWPWLGLPCGGMTSLADAGQPGDGLCQNFQRGRVEIRKDAKGNYLAPELGLVNQELLTLQGKL